MKKDTRQKHTSRKNFISPYKLKHTNLWPCGITQRYVISFESQQLLHQNVFISNDSMRAAPILIKLSSFLVKIFFQPHSTSMSTGDEIKLMFLFVLGFFFSF